MCGGKGVAQSSQQYLSMECGVLDALPSLYKKHVGVHTWEGKRQRRRKFTENLRFPHGGQYQGSTCLGQNWQGVERDLEGTAWQETGLARSSQG